MATLLIIDDDAALRESLAETLIDLGHRAVQAASGRVALDMAARERIDAVLLDLRMPGMDGLEILRRLRANGIGAPPVAILTAYATSANTIEAMRLGAFDHLVKPIGRDDLISLVARMLRSRRASDVTAAPAPAADNNGLIGASAAMRSVEKTNGLVADSDATVLITGERGTGKEVVARAIHRHGRRNAGPFIAVNCAAIPAELLESELFGHTRGAFTGAVVERRGAFRDADRGTLFLDEVGDMDFVMQANEILRALQERIVTPVGGRSIQIDVRILAATNRDLFAAVEAGRFREDLFYRLNVVPIHFSPLLERLADIVPLAEYFLRQAAEPPKRLTGGAAARLLAYAWPGNVRELKNAIERAAILSRSDTIAASDLDFLTIAPKAVESTATAWTEGDLPAAIARLEAYMILRALRESGGSRAEAARRLGMHRQLLYSKAQKYGIDIREPSGDQTARVVNPDKSRRATPGNSQ